jgi:DNA (cytosine-5)-methyltransferase 1
VARILKAKHPKYIMLENVRNLVSHDDGNTFHVIRQTLHDLGYRLEAEPRILSPYQFGIPQIRERVYILGVYDPKHADKPLEIELPKLMEKSDNSIDSMSSKKRRSLLWDHQASGGGPPSLGRLLPRNRHEVIGFPVWVAYFKRKATSDMPDWKQDFVNKNNKLYQENKKFIDSWLKSQQKPERLDSVGAEVRVAGRHDRRLDLEML